MPGASGSTVGRGQNMDQSKIGQCLARIGLVVEWGTGVSRSKKSTRATGPLRFRVRGAPWTGRLDARIAAGLVTGKPQARGGNNTDRANSSGRMTNPKMTKSLSTVTACWM